MVHKKCHVHVVWKCPGLREEANQSLDADRKGFTINMPHRFTVG